MPTLTANLIISYGSVLPNGAVPRREPYTFTLDYDEESTKIALVPPGSTDFVISLDTVGAPKFLFVYAELADVLIKLSDGVNPEMTTTSLSADAGWMMFVHPIGQPIRRLLVTTASSPISGAKVRVISFE